MSGNFSLDDEVKKFCGGNDKNQLPCELCHGTGIWDVPMSNSYETCPNLLRKKEEIEVKKIKCQNEELVKRFHRNSAAAAGRLN